MSSENNRAKKTFLKEKVFPAPLSKTSKPACFLSEGDEKGHEKKAGQFSGNPAT